MEKKLDVIATTDGADAYRNADFVAIAAPTNQYPKKNFFDSVFIYKDIEYILKTLNNILNPFKIKWIKRKEQ